MANLFNRPPPLSIEKLQEKSGSGQARTPTLYFNLAVDFLLNTLDFLRAADDVYLTEVTDVGSSKREVVLLDFQNKMKDIDEAMGNIIRERLRIQRWLDRNR